MSSNRRDFLKFLGKSGIATIGMTSLGSSFLASCTSLTSKNHLFKPLTPTSADDVKLVEGLIYNRLVTYGDTLNKKEEFGYNNDYTAFIPLEGKKDEAIFWVNHEAPGPTIMNTLDRSKKSIDKERKAVGGSLIHIKRDKNDNWQVVKNSKYNRRLDGTSKIPFAGGVKIKGQQYAIGTFANCAGGVTPWGNVLTCEENYHDYYGEIDFYTKKKKRARGYNLNWDKFYDLPPEHYGWVVEVDPLTGEAKKLTSLGRFAHESATVVKGKDGYPVVYSGDDKAGEFIYKFKASKKNSLEEGELFVADIKNGKWLSLDLNKNSELKKTFKNQLEVNINARIAGRILGATPCDRPEDIEIDPNTGAVFVCLTNNKSAGNYHGQILKIEEAGADHNAQNFKASFFAVGGEESGFSCPDNMAFDKAGNLWMATDISGSKMNKAPYKKFKNNGLFYFPLSGPFAGVAHQVASAPTDAEFTGLSFDSEGKRLFVSVQHPGERSKSLDDLSSHWPEGGNALPKPAVIQISGPLFNELMQG